VETGDREGHLKLLQQGGVIQKGWGAEMTVLWPFIMDVIALATAPRECQWGRGVVNKRSWACFYNQGGFASWEALPFPMLS
jgi:hypothetical protein